MAATSAGMSTTTTYIVTVAPGGSPLFHRLDPDGSPTPVLPGRLPPRVRLCGLSLQAWVSGVPLPPEGSGSVACSVLSTLPRSAPLRVAVVVEGAPSSVLH
jgi:hypothetical protein